MQIFLKFFSRLMIFYLAVCGKIIWLFVEISFGDLRKFYSELFNNFTPNNFTFLLRLFQLSTFLR